MIDAAHPFGVAAGEIIVDGDDMHALASEGVEIGGERRDKGLAFAGAHFGDRALMQNHPANELNIEMPLAEGAARRFPYRCESRHEQIVKALAGGKSSRNVWVRPASSASVSFSISGSSALIAATLGRYPLSRRSFDDPKIFFAKEPNVRNDLI